MTGEAAAAETVRPALEQDRRAEQAGGSGEDPRVVGADAVKDGNCPPGPKQASVWTVAECRH